MLHPGAPSPSDLLLLLLAPKASDPGAAPLLLDTTTTARDPPLEAAWLRFTSRDSTGTRALPIKTYKQQSRQAGSARSVGHKGAYAHVPTTRGG